MRFPILKSLSLAAVALSPAILPAGAAFERALATKDKDGRYAVDSLLIGCTTDPAAQEKIAKLYSPPCRHDHRGDEWVSLDLDPAIRPDIAAPVEDLEKHIRSISKRVFIEHLNDWAEDKPLFATYQGEMLRVLKRLMQPRSRLYMDFYPMVGILQDDSDVFCHDCSNSDYGIHPGNQVNSRTNPFWIVASRAHFALASQEGSPLDTWGGRDAYHAFYVPVLKEDKAFLSRAPVGADLEESCKATADKRLANLIADKQDDEAIPSAQAFYGEKLRKPILAFVQSLGFEDVRIVRCPVHPLNGRKNQLLIVATQPGGGADAVAATQETDAGRRDEVKTPGGSAPEESKAAQAAPTT